jgi:serine/threonine protein kinase
MTAVAADAGRYQVLGQLATGGMGEILLARRRGPAGFERLVVLKRPLAAARASRDGAAALVQEARLLARINHANVCQLHDLEEADGQYFLALELLEGLPLWTVLTGARDARRPIDPRAICGMFEQICDGLDAIHQLRMLDGTPAGVVHRDLSPGNLFVTESGTVKILDLGIAKTAASEELTPHGTIKGKLPYVAPEQVAGKPVDARTDLFALGLVLYDTARGCPPPSHRIGALACDALQLDGLPPPLARVIHRAVRPYPAERFGSAAELAVALRAASGELGGALGRAELAVWLQRDFAGELAAQRARTQAAIAGGAEPSVTRTLTLRSALLRSIGVDDDAPAGDVIHAPSTAAPLPRPSGWLPRATNRPPLPGRCPARA